MLSRSVTVKSIRQAAMSSSKRIFQQAPRHCTYYYNASTMDLVPVEDKKPIRSTLQYTVDRDFSTAPASSSAEISPELEQAQWQALLSAAEILHNDERQLQQQLFTIVSHEMDLIEAAERKYSFDKIILLMRHGEIVQDPDLTWMTGRGVGQSLTLARRTAAFCNDDTGLVPELIVTAPLRHVLRTTFLAFPYYTPQCVRGVTWICHPDATEPESTRTAASRIEREFYGVDCSLCHHDELMNLSKENSVEQAERFLSWLRDRDEQVIVVSGEASWLKALGLCMNYGRAADTFHNGEMRALGVIMS